jgi:hypothetical protein
MDNDLSYPNAKSGVEHRSSFCSFLAVADTASGLGEGGAGVSLEDTGGFYGAVSPE